MLHSPQIPSGTYSSAELAPASPIDAANENSLGTQSKATTRLTTALAVYVTIEFVAVTSSALFTAFLYHFFLRKSWSLNNFVSYASAATVIAILVLLISFAFKNFSAIRRQDRHKLLWSGIGTVSLAFSFFLTIFFLTQFGEMYSRATLVFQFVGACVAISVARALFYSWLHSAIASGRIEARRVALIGDTAQFSIFAERLKSSGALIVGSFHFPRHFSPERKRADTPTI